MELANLTEASMAKASNARLFTFLAVSKGKLSKWSESNFPQTLHVQNSTHSKRVAR